MKIFKALAVSCCLFLSLSQMPANAAASPEAGFSAAVKSTLAQLDKSPYKTLEVYTTSGSFSGELVSQSKDVIVLMTKTGSIHLKSNKKKILMTSVNVNTITAISIYVLDK